jgi:tetratricopeptide (TPR) repeat protein
MKGLAIVILALLLPTAAAAQHEQQMGMKMPATTLEKGLGRVSHRVTTSKPEAQRFFDQGLAFIYAFNHEQAVKSFKRAAEIDPMMAMAYWGQALALGSNYNLEADSAALKEAYADLRKAIELAPKASQKERDYIDALSKRYATDPDKVDKKQLASDYSNAMGELSKKYPDDLDAATLYAESMMNLRPWQLWTHDGKPADENTNKIVAVLESVLKRDPNHTGANHYYIHAVEASTNPERALPSAKRLGLIAPNAGHLVHMPSHIYIRTGDYAEAAKVNAAAVVVDRNYVEKNGPQGVYPMMYYNHNMHFLASANSMNGNFKEAIKWSRELQNNVKPALEAMPMLEMFAAYPLTTMIRFAKWDDILAEPQPDAKHLYWSAMWHFARGTAFAAKSKADDATKELDDLRSVQKAVPADYKLGNNPAVDLLHVANELLTTAVHRAKGDKEKTRHEFEQAVIAEDALIYGEPPDWDMPTRELFGQWLLTEGKFAEAEQVYRAELQKHPKNGRALFGLMQSLQHQNKDTRNVQKDFQKAWVNADTKLQ